MNDLKILLNKMAEEWEKTVMMTVMILILAYLAFVSFSLLSESEGGAQPGNRAKAAHEFYSGRAVAYLDPPNANRNDNPLKFNKKIQLRGRPYPQPNNNSNNNHNNNNNNNGNRQPNRPRPPNNRGNGQTTPRPPAGGGNTQPPRQDPTTDPPKPERKISVQYRGFIKGTEEELAFYSAQDSQGSKTESKSVRTGAKIHGVLEIMNFDGDQMTVSLEGKETSVKKGKKQDFIIQ